MDLVMFRSIVLVVLFIAFCVMVVWAWSPKRKKSFDEAAHLAVEDDLLNNNSKEVQP